MSLALGIVAALLLVFVVGEFAILYFTSARTGIWRKMLEAGKGSATILWARATMFLGALATVLVDLAGYLGAPGVADTIKAVLAPQYVGAFLVVVALVSEFARRRTL